MVGTTFEWLNQTLGGFDRDLQAMQMGFNRELEEMKAGFDRDLQDMKEKFGRDLQEMQTLIQNQTSELEEAREEIKRFRENQNSNQHRVCNPLETGDEAEGRLLPGGLSFAEILQNSPNAKAALEAAAMKAATSQEAAKCTEQMLERKRAIIVVVVQEPEGFNREEWRRRDRATMTEILEGLDMEEVDGNIEKVFRLGIYMRERKRLKKVVLTNEATQEKILSRKRRHVNYLTVTSGGRQQVMNLRTGEDRYTENDKEVCEELNKRFQEVFTIEHGEIMALGEVAANQATLERFEITRDEVKKHLLELDIWKRIRKIADGPIRQLEVGDKELDQNETDRNLSPTITSPLGRSTVQAAAALHEPVVEIPAAATTGDRAAARTAPT
ncbi:golgin subfamily A member 1-like [Procambarus clarkii]|uniref:golgin subfamily A member 1-like n=1 Tax=Procambarus clarkii TaxID=6728 RepID=UPI003742A9B6